MASEPQLKFRRLESDVDSILRQEEASCFCVAEKLLALGTRTGTVYLLSCCGDQVGVFHAHGAPVQDVCFDEGVETVGSCAENGSIVVQSLVSDEKFIVRLNRALNTLALDPKTIGGRILGVVSGGVSGKLTLSSPGWLGTKNVVLHSSQGPINQVKWCGNLIAWNNDHYIRVQNAITHELFGVINKPQNAPPESNCDLYWHPDGTLYIGWASTVIVAWLPVQNPEVSCFQLHSIKIIDQFEIQGLVKGVAPFGYQLAILTSKKHKNNKHKSKMTTPVIQVFSKSNIEISSDPLLNTKTTQFRGGFEFRMIPCFPTSCCKSKDDRSRLGAPSGRLLDLRGVDGTTNSTQGLMQWWQDGAEPLYYIFSSKEIFVGTPQNHHDRIQWLTKHFQFSKALSLASVIRNEDTKLWNETVDRYLEFLMRQGEFKEAAKLCPELLGTDDLRWKRYVYIFADNNHLIELCSYIPIQDPTLDSRIYNLVLKSLIKDPCSHQELLALVKDWPVTLYSPEELIEEIQDSLDSLTGDRKVLMEVLLQLCIFQGLHEKSMKLFWELKSPKVFDFILQHALFRFLKNKIISLILLDQNRALDLLSHHVDEVFPEQVIEEIKIQLNNSKNDLNQRNTVFQHWLYLYLDRVITENIFLAPDYHYLLIELYAKFESPKLMQFLINSHQYPLDRAFEVCKEKKLIKEMVYVLSRMGDAQGALQLIIEELADIPQAIEFARSQDEDHLWDLIINWAVVSSPSTTGDLLDHAGGQVDPLRVINKIPKNMEIWNLRNRLCRVISEYRTQTKLQEGSNSILKSDCVGLDSQLYNEMRHCFREVYITSNVTLQSQDPAIWSLYHTINGNCVLTSKPSLEVSPQGARSSLEIGFFSEKSDDFGESVRSGFPRKQHSLDRNRDPLPRLI